MSNEPITGKQYVAEDIEKIIIAHKIAKGEGESSGVNKFYYLIPAETDTVTEQGAPAVLYTLIEPGKKAESDSEPWENFKTKITEAVTSYLKRQSAALQNFVFCAHVGGNHWATYVCNTHGEIMVINSLAGYTNWDNAAIAGIKAAFSEKGIEGIEAKEPVSIQPPTGSDPHRFKQKNISVCGPVVAAMACAISSEPLHAQQQTLETTMAKICTGDTDKGDDTCYDMLYTEQNNLIKIVNNTAPVADKKSAVTEKLRVGQYHKMPPEILAEEARQDEISIRENSPIAVSGKSPEEDRWVHYQQQEKEKAKQDFSVTIEIPPNGKTSLYELGTFEENNKRFILQIKDGKNIETAQYEITGYQYDNSTNLSSFTYQRLDDSNKVKNIQNPNIGAFHYIDFDPKNPSSLDKNFYAAHLQIAKHFKKTKSYTVKICYNALEQEIIVQADNKNDSNDKAQLWVNTDALHSHDFKAISTLPFLEFSVIGLSAKKAILYKGILDTFDLNKKKKNLAQKIAKKYLFEAISHQAALIAQMDLIKTGSEENDSYKSIVSEMKKIRAGIIQQLQTYPTIKGDSQYYFVPAHDLSSNLDSEKENLQVDTLLSNFEMSLKKLLNQMKENFLSSERSKHEKIIQESITSVETIKKSFDGKKEQSIYTVNVYYHPTNNHAYDIIFEVVQGENTKYGHYTNIVSSRGAPKYTYMGSTSTFRSNKPDLVLSSETYDPKKSFEPNTIIQNLWKEQNPENKLRQKILKRYLFELINQIREFTIAPIRALHISNKENSLINEALELATQIEKTLMNYFNKNCPPITGDIDTYIFEYIKVSSPSETFGDEKEKLKRLQSYLCPRINNTKQDLEAPFLAPEKTKHAETLEKIYDDLAKMENKVHRTLYSPPKEDKDKGNSSKKETKSDVDDEKASKKPVHSKKSGDETKSNEEMIQILNKPFEKRYANYKGDITYTCMYRFKEITLKKLSEDTTPEGYSTILREPLLKAFLEKYVPSYSYYDSTCIFNQFESFVLSLNPEISTLDNIRKGLCLFHLLGIVNNTIENNPDTEEGRIVLDIDKMCGRKRLNNATIESFFETLLNIINQKESTSLTFNDVQEVVTACQTKDSFLFLAEGNFSHSDLTETSLESKPGASKIKASLASSSDIYPRKSAPSPSFFPPSPYPSEAVETKAETGEETKDSGISYDTIYESLCQSQKWQKPKKHTEHTEIIINSKIPPITVNNEGGVATKISPPKNGVLSHDARKSLHAIALIVIEQAKEYARANNFTREQTQQMILTVTCGDRSACEFVDKIYKEAGFNLKTSESLATRPA